MSSPATSIQLNSSVNGMRKPPILFCDIRSRARFSRISRIRYAANEKNSCRSVTPTVRCFVQDQVQLVPRAAIPEARLKSRQLFVLAGVAAAATPAFQAEFEASQKKAFSLARMIR